MVHQFLFRILFPIAVASRVAHSFAPFLSPKPPRFSWELSMALTPVGPFCPFHSKASWEMQPRVDEIEHMTLDFAAEFSRIQQELMMGQTPDANRLRKVADDMDAAVDHWEGLLTRLRITPDFQTKEYAKLTDAHLKAHGVSPQMVASMMRWQSGCMRSLADNTPPPLPPPDLNLEAMINDARQNGESDRDSKTPSISAMQAAEKITASPFDPESFESEPIKQEYKKLVMDHSNLIEFGSQYDEFDPLGKLSFLDQIEAIEERWDAFFFRFKLMDSLNQDFIQQCEQFLASMKLTEDEYRELLKESHRLMRLDAERERNRSYS
jgi:Domain of unknown function (DUF1825)